MIECGCMNYDGDYDCSKCTVHGYIYNCDGCEDYIDFFGRKKITKEDKYDKQRNV